MKIVSCFFQFLKVVNKPNRDQVWGKNQIKYKSYITFLPFSFFIFFPFYKNLPGLLMTDKIAFSSVMPQKARDKRQKRQLLTDKLAFSSVMPQKA